MIKFGSVNNNNNNNNVDEKFEFCIYKEPVHVNGKSSGAGCVCILYMCSAVRPSPPQK
jgi:hypothetical protein